VNAFSLSELLLSFQKLSNNSGIAAGIGEPQSGFMIEDRFKEKPYLITFTISEA